MQPSTLVSVLTGLVLAAPILIAQEKEREKKKVRPAAVRVMRLTAAGPRTPPTPEELGKRYAAKLEGAWIKNANWITDYDQAKATASESGKPIVAYFTRSYAP